MTRTFVPETALQRALTERPAMAAPGVSYGGGGGGTYMGPYAGGVTLPPMVVDALMNSPLMRKLMRPPEQLAAERRLKVEAVMKGIKLIVDRWWGKEQDVQAPPPNATAAQVAVYQAAVEKERVRANELKQLVADIEAIATPLAQIALADWT